MHRQRNETVKNVITIREPFKFYLLFKRSGETNLASENLTLKGSLLICIVYFIRFFGLSI